MRKNKILVLGILAPAFALVFSGCAVLSDLLFGGATAETRTSPSNREIFDSWIGSHYTKLGQNITGRVSYNENSITYDSSWTEDERVRRSSSFNALTGQGMGEYGWVRTGRTITHEKWVTFYFDGNGIITTWRSKGWEM